jgi:hypothetical protein
MSALYFHDYPTAVYRAFAEGGRLLYVGHSAEPETRISQHLGKTAWWPKVRKITTEWHPSRPIAQVAERLAIYREDPLYNISRARTPKAVAGLMREARRAGLLTASDTA